MGMESRTTVEPIAFFSTHIRDEQLREEIGTAFAEVVSRGVYVGGPFVEAFETQWAEYCRVDQCVGVGNGLDALSLLLRGLGVGPGDEVIVPAFTFVATWLAVISVGATPIPADVSASSGLLDAEAASALISPRTAAVIPVHLFGQMWRDKYLEALCERTGIAIIHDAAQAHGLEGLQEGRRHHHWAYSFYPTKNLGALGDAGAVTTNDSAVASQVRLLRSYGSEAGSYRYVAAGINSRLDPLQANLLSKFLPNLDQWNATRRSLASDYFETIRHSRHAVALSRPSETTSVWHHFVVRVKRREAYRKRLLKHGLETRIHYPQAIPAVPPIQNATGQRYVQGQFPHAETLARECVSFPMHPWLGPRRSDCLAVLRDYS